MTTPGSSETLQAQELEKDLLLESSDNIPSWYLSKAKSPNSTIRFLVGWLVLLSFLGGGLVVYILVSHGNNNSNRTSPHAPGSASSRSPLLNTATILPLLSAESPPLACGETVKGKTDELFFHLHKSSIATRLLPSK